MELTSTQVQNIHEAIHGTAVAVWINSQRYPVELSPRSHCRFIQVGELKFIEQNPESPSTYAALAKEGRAITWAIHKTRRGPWGRIVDGVIEHPVGEA